MCVCACVLIPGMVIVKSSPAVAAFGWQAEAAASKRLAASTSGEVKKML